MTSVSSQSGEDKSEGQSKGVNRLRYLVFSIIPVSFTNIIPIARRDEQKERECTAED